MVLVHEGLICEGGGPDLALSPHFPYGMRWGLEIPSAPLPPTQLPLGGGVIEFTGVRNQMIF